MGHAAIEAAAQRGDSGPPVSFILIPDPLPDRGDIALVDPSGRRSMARLLVTYPSPQGGRRQSAATAPATVTLGRKVRGLPKYAASVCRTGDALLDGGFGLKLIVINKRA